MALAVGGFPGNELVAACSIRVGEKWAARHIGLMISIMILFIVKYSAVAPLPAAFGRGGPESIHSTTSHGYRSIVLLAGGEAIPAVTSVVAVTYVRDIGDPCPCDSNRHYPINSDSYASSLREGRMVEGRNYSGPFANNAAALFLMWGLQ